jgi:hypothetical protein
MSLFDTLASVANKVATPEALMPPDFTKSVKKKDVTVQKVAPVQAPSWTWTPGVSHEKNNTLYYVIGGVGLAIAAAIAFSGRLAVGAHK